MANTTVGASVQVEFQSVGQMRKAIKEATSDLIAMQEQFGKTSPQAIEAAKRIAEMRDRIEDAKEQADLFDPGKKFQAFTTAAGQIAAGFSAVQGAMALVGTESEDLQKTLVKVQGAMALSQGLSQIGDLGKSFDALKVTAVNTFNAIRTAIGTSGIGLLVIALAGIVAYWDDIKAAVSGVSEEQKKLNEDSAKNLKTQKDKLDSLNLQENSLKLQGKSEKDILQLKIKQTDQIIKASEISLKNNIDTLNAQVEAEKRNKQILEGLLKFVSLPITAVLKGIDAIGSAVGKNFGLEEKFFGGIASLVFDPEETKKKGDETIKEQQKSLNELKSQRDGFQLQINQIDKEAAKKSAETQKGIDEKTKKAREDADKVLQDARKSQLTERQREEAEALAKFQQNREILAKAGNTNFLDIEIQYQISLRDIRIKYEKEEKDRIEKEQKDKLEKDKERQNKDIENKKAQFEKIRLAAQEDLKDQEEVEKAKQQLYADTGNALGVLSDIVGKETAAGKALAIAQATINTWLGVTEVLKQKSVLPEPAATISKVVNVATIVASGLKAVSNIVKTQVPKGGGGGGSSALSGAAPITAQPTPTVTAQALNAQAINQLGNQSMRAYILNSDMQNNEQRNAYLERNARLG
jgi:hypothetical protein